MSLYKYMPWERRDIFSGNHVRFSQPVVWNDPFEVVHFYNIEKQQPSEFRLVLNSLFNTVMYSSESKLTAENQIYGLEVSEVERIINEYIVGLSLSTRKDSILMWSHYADLHQGFIVEFDEEHPFFKDNKKALIKIPYSENRVVLNKDKTLTILEKMINKMYAGEKLDSTQLNLLSELFTKYTDWSYECEYRLVALTNHCDKFRKNESIGLFRAIKNFVLNQKIPYYKAAATIDSSSRGFHIESKYIALFNVPIECIKSVILGCKMEKANVATIKEIFRGNNIKTVKLYKAEMEKDSYDFSYAELDAFKKSHFVGRRKGKQWAYK